MVEVVSDTGLQCSCNWTPSQNSVVHYRLLHLNKNSKYEEMCEYFSFTVGCDVHPLYV